MKRRTCLTLPPCLWAEIVGFYTFTWYNAIFLRRRCVEIQGKFITCIWLWNTDWVCTAQCEWVSWSWLKHSIGIITCMKHETLLSQQGPDLKTLCFLADVQPWVQSNLLKGVAIVNFIWIWHWRIFQMGLPMFAFDSFQVQWHASLERPRCWRTWEFTLFHRQLHPHCYLRHCWLPPTFSTLTLPSSYSSLLFILVKISFQLQRHNHTCNKI